MMRNPSGGRRSHQEVNNYYQKQQRPTTVGHGCERASSSRKERNDVKWSFSSFSTTEF